MTGIVGWARTSTGHAIVPANPAIKSRRRIDDPSLGLPQSLPRSGPRNQSPRKRLSDHDLEGARERDASWHVSSWQPRQHACLPVSPPLANATGSADAALVERSGEAFLAGDACRPRLCDDRGRVLRNLVGARYAGFRSGTLGCLVNSFLAWVRFPDLCIHTIAPRSAPPTVST